MPNVSSRTKMSENLVIWMKTSVNIWKCRLIRQIIVFRVGRMNECIHHSETFSLSDYIQLIHWYFLYPQIENRDFLNIWIWNTIWKNTLWALNEVWKALCMCVCGKHHGLWTPYMKVTIHESHHNVLKGILQFCSFLAKVLAIARGIKRRKFAPKVSTSFAFLHSKYFML